MRMKLCFHGSSDPFEFRLCIIVTCVGKIFFVILLVNCGMCVKEVIDVS